MILINSYRTNLRAGALVSVIVICFVSSVSALQWPVWPDSSHHQIWAMYAMFQHETFLHNGIDIIVPYMTEVYAVESGYVKTIMTIGGESSWRIVIADSAGTQECEGWMYAHIVEYYVYHSVGDWVEEGEIIGRIVNWPGYPETTQEHLHFSRIRFGGDSAAWANGFWDGWEFIANPMDLLDYSNINDTTPPVFENAWGEQLLAFCENETTNYFDENAPISGDVDVICRVYDYHDFYLLKDTPHKLEYKIDGDSSIPWTTLVIFDESFGTYQTVTQYMSIMYQNDYYCNSGNFSPDSQVFYYNLTNTDGDGSAEQDDKLECWPTPYFHNGDYTVSVRATDYVGQSTAESMVVTVENFFELHGTITLETTMGDWSGTVITTPCSGVSDTTDADGHYLISFVGGGTQAIEVHRNGYISADTMLMMNQNRQFDAALYFDFMCGDANGDVAVNILDITYLISYLYKEGPSPDVLEAANVNHDSAVNILDITYLISFLYKSGPEPDCFNNKK